MEKSGEVVCYHRRGLNWGKVAAARKDRPAPDVVYAFQIRARRLAFGNRFVREDTERRGSVDVGGVERVPVIIPIVAHRCGDGLRDPVEREGGAEEIIGGRDLAPRVPLLAEPGG